MRLALQALFSTIETNEEETARRALLERRLRTNERSAGFFRRLREVVDDETLQAPEVFAEESFPDVNVVAEYLDAQTSAELARDYEDACWNSPEILAEIGRCYDILNSDALNNVVVPKNCRRRLYYIAWEESVVNLANEENAEENESILTNFAPPASKNVEETRTFEREEAEERAKEEKFSRNVPRSKEREREKTEKPTKSIGLALAAERSWGRRVKRISGRLVFALALLGACYCGWQTLNDDKSSETFQLETAQNKLAETNSGVGQNANEESPLSPTTISSVSPDEIPTTSLPEEPATLAENDRCADVLEGPNEEKEPYKLAVLPNITSESGYGSRFNGETKGGTRSGLTVGEPWERRPSLEIPAQNNDVFTNSKLY